MTQLSLNNRSFGRMAQLTTLAAEADYRSFANANLAEFFKALVTMTDHDIVELIDLYNATADINAVVEKAVK